MRFFGLGGGDPESAEATARREASQRNMEQGGLPLNAIDRLREQAARQGTPQHFFTSDLSVSELALTHQAGYDPLGQVMGSSIYHVGWQWTPANNNMWGWNTGSAEMTVLTEAYYNARHLALGRLQQEAALLGASGVIGVRLERKSYEWGEGMLEFAAIGTAIREADTPPVPNTLPFLSALSGSEFWMLRQSGYRPVGFALGNCTYYCVPNWQTQSATMGGFFGSSWQNQELVDYTQAVYNARALAMGRMEDEARRCNAEGILGADIEVFIEPREIDRGNGNKRIDLIYHFTAIGTAVAPYSGRWPLLTIPNTVSLG